MESLVKIVKGFFVILTIVFLCGFLSGTSRALATDNYEKRIDRIDEALREGRISLKASVLQKARVLHDPHRAPLEGEELGDETPRLELVENVRRTFEILTKEEKAYLRSLSSDLAWVVKEEESGGQPQKAPAPQRLPSTFDRVSSAQDYNEITLKEAVFLKARLLFAPHTIRSDNPFSVQAGEVPVHEPYMMGFYKDVHQVFDQLTQEEIAFLKSLSPDLKGIMVIREHERSGIVGSSMGSALPDYPDLDQTEEGRNCIVHYTLTGANAAPDKTYVELVRLYMDKAIESDMTKHFTTAYAEGYPDFKGKLHVYLIDIGANGEWMDRSIVSGKKRAGCIKFGTKMKDSNPDGWQLHMKAVCFHEYFHGIQSAYNSTSGVWFMEATAVWAECYYGGMWNRLETIYKDADSIFNKPNYMLWLNLNGRGYSASALVFFLSDKFGAHNFIKSWMLNWETEDDCIKTLQQALTAKNTAFEEEYIYYLASLYAKSIKSIKKYMPDVKIETMHNTYGLDRTAGTVFLTGANFYAFDPQAGAQPGTFIATFTPYATGMPKGVLVTKKGKKVGVPMAFLPHISGSPTAYVKDFGKATKKIVLIVTDTTYTTKDETPRSYDYTAIVPNITIRQVTAESPIYSGDSSQLNIHYDLTGIFPGNTFPAQLKVVEKGPGVADNASGEVDLDPGTDQILPLWFNTAWDSHGTYKFTFQLTVPPDSWLPIPQVKSKGKCSVRVEEPSESAMVLQATTREIKKPVLTINK
jgi:hypothetical protein